MPIIYNEKNKTFHIKTKNTSYILKILESSHLIHLYWGKRISTENLDYIIDYGEHGSFLAETNEAKAFQLESMMQEYPSYGSTDLRSPGFEIKFEDGSTVSDFRYNGHKIYKGKKGLKGLPSTYDEKNDAETLEIYLKDKLKNTHITLTYTAFDNFDAIIRNALIKNDSSEKVKILRALSANVDFNNNNYDFIQLSGSWARERHIERNALRSGSQSVESRRGASSHAQNPFIALSEKDTTEFNGNVYSMNLVYSGNFLANVEVDMYHNTRMQIGINPFDFEWLLESGEEFQTPEAVLVYSDKGLNGMSQIYHNLYRKALCRGKYRDKERPVLINNWEATYFDFDEGKIKEIAKCAADLGVELFVLDDGWFGERDNDDCSLGDWFVNENKLRGGLKKLAEDINEMGLKFGLWFEPEMISPISKLYEKHPNWCIHVNGRNRSQARNQLILDLSRDEVCEYVIESVSNILKSAPISYVKWDMNRNMTEIGSETLSAERQRETAHRYMLGLYRILEEITSRFPDILFESCSGGGGRFDPGMLYYMPQTWTSDNTDAIERLKIQFGTSMAYPSVSMGCHVSVVPNHQVNRITPLKTRGITAMAGNFGYELDVTKMSDEDKNEVKEQIKLYKKIRNTIQFGTSYRLLSPFNNNIAAWINISEDKNEAVVAYVKQYAEANILHSFIKVKGLEEDAKYKILNENRIVYGSELMEIGLKVPNESGDYVSGQWILQKFSE